MAASVDCFKWKEIKERIEKERAKYGGQTREEILEEMLAKGLPYKKAIDAAWDKLEMYENALRKK